MSTTVPAAPVAPKPHAALRSMLVLTFATGIVDAVGYLGLDRVFTGNMTGNVVILGMGIAGAERLPVLGPLLALGGFLVGAAVGGRALRSYGKGWTSATTPLLSVVSVVFAAVAILLATDADPAHGVALTITTVLGAAMGLQAATARQIGVPDVSTVVVTSTITGLAADSWFGNRTGAHVSRRGGAVVLILAGACAGALLLKWELWSAVAVAAVINTVVATTGERW